MANETHTNDDRTGRVLALLKDPIPNITLLPNALRRAEACYIGVVSDRVAAQTRLYNERLRFRHPKDKELTDWDRKLLLDAHTSEVQAEYELLAGMEKA